MKKSSLFLFAMLFALLPVLQSCSDDDGYSIGDIGRDWATVRTTGGGGYFLIGDTWGSMWPAATSIPWFKPVDGERAIVLFNPLQDNFEGYNVAVKVERIYPVLTKTVEELTAENNEEYGNDPITIYEGDMWLGGTYLNLIFQQRIPTKEKHRISLVRNTTESYEEDGYVHLELRYNTYKDESDYWQLAPVSFNVGEFYSTVLAGYSNLKGFKVKINSKVNGERILVLDLKNPVAVPKSVHGINDSFQSALK